VELPNAASTAEVRQRVRALEGDEDALREHLATAG
jgi:hypothetical protein